MKLFSLSLLIEHVFIGLPLMIFLSCKKYKSPPPTAPAVTTLPLTNITTSSAITGGTILTDGNAAIIQSGIVWSKTNAVPTLTDSVTAGTTSSGSFATNLTGLDFNTLYYLRAFATNRVGTGYGDVLTLNTTNDTSKVRFMYNGQEVVYGIIISAVTGKKWLDRNLGATQAAMSYDDYNAYGDLFQWGRPDDGHQLMNWIASDEGSPVNGISTAVATSNTPGYNTYILPPYDKPLDWRSDNNSDRWVTSPQGPCPNGWHVPTITEWLAEVSKMGGITDRNTAYSKLKLTVAGFRVVEPGAMKFGQVGRAGHYWSSLDVLHPDGFTIVKDLEIGPDYASTFYHFKSEGLCVRCVKN